MSFTPPDMLSIKFTVLIENELLDGCEQVALVGNLKSLGAWRANQAVLLMRTNESNVWSVSVLLPRNVDIVYRYLIVAIDADTSSIQVRHWETTIIARRFSTKAGVICERNDKFGRISSTRYEVQRGWLNSGSIVHLKLFNMPLHMFEVRETTEILRFKLIPVDPKMLTPILPSARACAEYLQMENGRSSLRIQPEYGVRFAQKDKLFYHVTVSSVEKVAYLLHLYATKANSDLVRLIGLQYIYPENITGSEGSFDLTLMSPILSTAIGILNVHYLVIEPIENLRLCCHTTFANFWHKSWVALDVGHRGLGRSLNLDSNVPPAIENTVASMIASANLGADLVEFDVVVTQDLVPIIYHDFSVHICKVDGMPESQDDLVELMINNVTYAELKTLKTYRIFDTKVVQYPAPNDVAEENERLFPLLEDFLTKVDTSIGFDIEIKWPQLQSDGVYESYQTIDKNIYVDSILKVMLRYGCGRVSFFSSFDADICCMLRFKQHMHPVMFIMSETNGFYADPRSDTVQDCLNFVQGFDLAGIIPNAVHIKNDPSVVRTAQKINKKIYLWGDLLKDTTSIQWFKSLCPTGVIFDRLDLWLAATKKNVFTSAPFLHDFLLLQCEPLVEENEEDQSCDCVGETTSTYIE